MESAPSSPNASLALAIQVIPSTQWPEAFAYGEAFFRDRQLPGTYSPQRALETWSLLWSSRPATMFGAYIDGKLIGGIAVAILQDEWSDHIYAAEAFYFVAPGFRRDGLGLQLLTAFEDWARQAGVSDIRLAAFHVHDHPLMDRFYRRHGYEGFQTTYRKELR